MTNASTGIKEKALALLGQNVSAEHAAATLGVEPAYISQLLSQDDFKEAVLAAKFKTLTAHNERDAKYDTLEDTLLSRFETMQGMMFTPDKILKAMQVVNAMKRRGVSAPEVLQTQNPVVTIVMPTKIVQKFTTNIQNQVIEAGQQQLVTIQSGTLMDQLKKLQASKVIEGNQNDTASAGAISYSRVPS